VKIVKIVHRENATEKSRQRTERKIVKPGYRLYIFIALSKFTTAGGSKYWFLAVDEATHMKFSMFLKQKSDLKEKFILFLKEL